MFIMSKIFKNGVPPVSNSNMVGTVTNPSNSASVLPLPSNVNNKSTYQLEAQYMQQQSQIFVFSTALANKAAESYLSGSFPSIIAFHCAQPGTKSFLEKFPFKVQQFNRQNHPAWLNSLAQEKQLPGNCQPKQPMCMFSNNHHPPMMNGTVNQGTNLRQPMVGPPGCGNYSGCMENLSPSCAVPFQNSGPDCQPLAGVKVPYENLTPQQRKHREEQLSTIQKMKLLLFPEQQINEGGLYISNACARPDVGNQNQLEPRPHFPKTEGCMHSGVSECFSPHQQPMVENDHPQMPVHMYSESQMFCSNPMQQNYPPVCAQMEWQKLQCQYYDERTKKVVTNCPSQNNSFQGMQNQTALPNSVSQPSTPQECPCPGIRLSPSSRMQGPPPPYKASKLAVPSPDSPSPNSGTLSSVSCLSPADLASRQFPVPTPPGHKFSQASPGSSSTAENNSLQTTPLNSPKPPETLPNITHHRAPATPSNMASTPCGSPSPCHPVLSTSNPATPTAACSSNTNQSQFS